jgi:hypothetical protein
MTDTHEKNKQAVAGIVVALGFWATGLAGVWILCARGYGCDTGPRRVTSEVEDLHHAVEVYRSVRGRNPTSLDELAAVRQVRELARLGPTKDPWGLAYLLVCPSTEGPCGVISAGPDGEFGTADDVRSWDVLERDKEPRAATGDPGAAAGRGANRVEGPVG